MRTSNGKSNGGRLLRAAGWLVVFSCSAMFAMLALLAPISAQQAAVTAQVEILQQKAGQPPAAAGGAADASNVVVWLTPLDVNAALASAQPGGPVQRLVQRNKTFEPHLLVVVAGTAVEFPNQDPFLHNVFSLFDGKRFDLGFYEAGSSRTVHFDRAGVSFLFCNIHPDMSAVVVAVPTRYYGISDRAGRVTIANVPDGRYRLQAWYERSLPESLKNVERTVTISGAGRSLAAIQLVANPGFTSDHKNKFGQDYVPPSGSAY